MPQSEDPAFTIHQLSEAIDFVSDRSTTPISIDDFQALHAQAVRLMNIVRHMPLTEVLAA